MIILFKQSAARQIQRERAWLMEHRGRERADDFEAELAHTLDLLEAFPAMGPPSRWSADERHVFLLRSRYHVFYRLHVEAAGS